MTFARGQTGNPRGRPRKGNSLTDILRRSASQAVDEEDRRTKAEAAAAALLNAAMAGDVPALKLLFERLDGPAQPTAPEVPAGTHVRRIVIEDVRYGEVAGIPATESTDAVTVTLPGAQR